MRARTERRLRQDVARRAGAEPGGEWIDAHCAYCEWPLIITWPAPFEGASEPAFFVRDSGGLPLFGEAAHLDHVIPESRNGPTSLDNTVIACRPCNMAKGASAFGDPDFLAWLSARRAARVGVVL